MPEHIERGDIEGEVIVKIKVSDKGDVSSAEIVQSLDSLCDAEVLRVVSLMPNVIPALSNGKRIASERTLTFNFRNYQPAKFGEKDWSLSEYFRKNLQKPEEAKDNEKGSKVVVKLFITKEGKVEEATIEEGLSPACDQEALHLAKGMPKWQPATRDGQNIDSYFNLFVPFEGTSIMPEFPGGEKAMMEFIGENIKYPADAQKAGRAGRVTVRFIVDNEGNITDPEVMKGVHPSLDKEALRVINKMPRWKPGTVGGKPIEVYFAIPINFRLRDKAKNPTHINTNIDQFGRPKTNRPQNRFF